MSESPTGVRQRASKKKARVAGDPATASGSEDELLKPYPQPLASAAVAPAKDSVAVSYKIALVVLTLLAFATRFYNIESCEKMYSEWLDCSAPMRSALRQ